MKKILLILILISLPMPAFARIYIRVDEISEQKFPIALTKLVNKGEERDKKDWSSKVPETLYNDLRMTGLFAFVEDDLFPKGDALNVRTDQVDFASWNLLGIQALVKGAFQYIGETVEVELYLYDPVIQQPIIGQQYTANRNDVRIVAHHFADQIVEALTGHPGIFRTQLAYVAEGRRSKEIYVMGIDAQGQRRITSNRGINISPAWAPRGDKLAYTSYTDKGDAEISVFDFARKAAVQVTNNKGVNLSPTWMRDGRRLTVSMSNDTSNIFNISLAGRTLQQLTDHWGIDIAPSWSPDGSSFAFASERAGGLHLFRADTRGRNIKRLTFVGYHNDNPAWSPDGKKIAFQGRDQGVWDLFIMNADGTLIQRLTSSAGNNQEPTWAPSSQFIAFSSNRTGQYQIYVMTAQGEAQTRLPTGPSATQPDWGPFID